MENNDKFNRDTEREKTFFAKLQAPYSKSKEEVWAGMQAKMTAKPPQAAKQFWMGWAQTAAAASLLLMIGAGLFMRLYTTEINAPAGKTLSHVLPDGSQVHLNAETSIAYAPYWWPFGREIKMEGEAFFEVAKGKKFSVISQKGNTEVLGTEFNILARGEAYQVYCQSGKVKVAGASVSALLAPGESVRLDGNEMVKESGKTTEEAVLAWRMGKFAYNSAPLKTVLEDIERHYGVKIETDIQNIGGLSYTGFFDRTPAPADALRIVCASYGFRLEEGGKGRFRVKAG